MQLYPTADKIINFTCRLRKKKYWRAILRKSTTRLLEECLFSVIFMNIDLRKVNEIANWTYLVNLIISYSSYT